MPRMVPAVVLSAVSLKSVPVKLPVLEMPAAVPENAVLLAYERLLPAIVVPPLA